MNYEQARAYLDEKHRYGGEIGLEKLQKLLEYLGDPQNQLSFIHIAGTNGKGSVLAYVSTVLTTAGYRVGRYVSPTLYSYEERFQIDGCPIDKDRFAKLMTQVAKGVKQMERDGFQRPTPFELETALGFLYFRQMNCDLVVLECGMGGLTDATNVVEHTKVAVITSISLDHMEYLGGSLREITRQKAGIIKNGTAVVTLKQDPEIMHVLEETCAQKRSQMQVADPQAVSGHNYQLEQQSFTYKGETYSTTMTGLYQIENAVLAIEVIHALQKQGYRITEEMLQQGLQKTSWPGRFSILGENPYFIVDGAHNPDGAQKFVKSLLKAFTGRRFIYIMGVLKDKQYNRVLDLTLPYGEQVITIETPDNDRALSAQALAQLIKTKNKPAIAAESLEEAVELAYTMADEQDVIVAFGSLSFIGPLTELVKNRRKP